jgi:hypothetical protein
MPFKKKKKKKTFLYGLLSLSVDTYPFQINECGCSTYSIVAALAVQEIKQEPK